MTEDKDRDGGRDTLFSTDFLGLSDHNKVSAQTVASWFPVRPHGRPDARWCQEMAFEFSIRRQMREAYPADPLGISASKRWGPAIRAARDFRDEMDKIKRDAPEFLAGLPEADDAMEAVSKLLNAQRFDHPVVHTPGPGNPGTPWLSFAREWAPKVKQVLEKHVAAGGKKATISVSTPAGPVVAVLQHAIKFVLGCDPDMSEIGAAIRRASTPTKLGSVPT